jgi:hypothetical protein
MTTNQIRKATKKMTFEQANIFITNLGFELVVSENHPFLKSWEVKNNNEIYRISNYLNSLTDNLCDVKFGYND